MSIAHQFDVIESSKIVFITILSITVELNYYSTSISERFGTKIIFVNITSYKRAFKDYAIAVFQFIFRRVNNVLFCTEEAFKIKKHQL